MIGTWVNDLMNREADERSDGQFLYNCWRLAGDSRQSWRSASDNDNDTMYSIHSQLTRQIPHIISDVTPFPRCDSHA
jgi:hypothetical protein